MKNSARVCIFIPTFGDGGVERMLVNLGNGLSKAGASVDFMVNRAEKPYLHTLVPAVRIIELRSSRPHEVLQRLVDYLQQERPAALLSAKLRDDHIAVRAKELSGGPTRVILRTGTTISERLGVRKRNPIKKWLTYRNVRRSSSQADGLVAVSEGVARDLVKITGIPLERIHIIRNPVITLELEGFASEPVDHPWLVTKESPVILGIGGLRRAKDFPSLIRAFAKVRQQRPCRLMILGRGRQRTRLENLAADLGVADDVALPGFVSNPYAYMAKADLFVLSSVWEGSPNVLTEALAIGLPVVSTDCPSGPREVLQNGRYGSLVPVGDVQSLAQAILETLANPPDRSFLASAVKDYTVEASARQYLRVMGVNPPVNSTTELSPTLSTS